MKNRNIAIFDGDNTLWDTNEVFTSAQKEILQGLARVGIPADPNRDFDLLRRMDDLLVKHFGNHEYDNSHLALCLLRHYRGERIDEVEQVARIVGVAESADVQLAQELGAGFLRALARVPELLPDVADSLSEIYQAGLTLMVLYSEGQKNRLTKIVDTYQMSKVFHHIVLGDKSNDDWAKVKDAALRLFNERYPNHNGQPQLYVIGDRLERDIRPGNLIGAKTLYKPGGYKRRETPKDKYDEPTIVVQSMREVVRLLCTP
jgi:FMN phosphatase YigB (HAD superfamily)